MEHTLEYQNWGWNALSLSAVMTMVFTFFEGWGLYQQNKTIWQHKSAEAVSVVWMTYFATMFTVITIYGMTIYSVALVFNGVILAVLHIPIMRGLWRFKQLRQFELIVSVTLAVALALMILLPYKAWFFFAFSLGSILSIAMQPLEMWWKHTAKDVNIRLLAVYLASTFFWVVYGYAIDDWVLKIICPAALVLFGWAVLLWWRYDSHGNS